MRTADLLDLIHCLIARVMLFRITFYIHSVLSCAHTHMLYVVRDGNRAKRKVLYKCLLILILHIRAGNTQFIHTSNAQLFSAQN